MELYKLNNFKRLSERSSQGNVGTCTFEGDRKVWKTSKRHDFTLTAEYEVSKAISDSCLGILPHFAKVTHLIPCLASPSDNINQDCIMIDKISGGRFNDVLRNRLLESKDTLCMLKQVLVSLVVAQQVMAFTHYDLHVENILVRQTNFDLHIYITPDGYVYPVETHGLCPIIIDYGYTFVDRFQTLLPSLYFNSSGFTSYKSDPLRDIFTLLCSINAEIRDPNSKLLAETKDLFKPILAKAYRLEWEHGWLEGFTNAKKTFQRYLTTKNNTLRFDSIISDTSMMADLLLALIPTTFEQPSQYWPTQWSKSSLNLEQNNYQQAVLEFYYEWFYIEEELNNFGLEALFMKLLIQAVKEDNLTGVHNLVKKTFLREFEVNYLTLICNLIIMADRLTLAIKEMNHKDNKRLSNIYSKLNVRNLNDVLQRLDANVFPSPIYGKDKTLVFDLRGKGSVRRMTITNDQARKLNKGSITIESIVL